MKKSYLFFILLIFIPVFCRAAAADGEKIHIDVLILPKFEVQKMHGDFPGEAQYYYEAYLAGGEEYEITEGFQNHKLYVKDGIALYVTGMGKVNSAISTMAVLSDDRFDFSDAYVLSTGCGGTAVGYGVMGDVFIITSIVDYDLGHHADIREMSDPSASTWFRDSSYDDIAYILLDPSLMDRVYDLVKDVRIETTDVTRNFMAAAFDNADWAVRDPMVLRGTTISSDNYWKGIYPHQNAVKITESYGCPDPFAMTEMEEIAVGTVLKRMNMLDRLIIIRDSVNMDVFMLGQTPESLWNPDFDQSLASDSNAEAADIFETAQKNNFAVGSMIIQAVLNGTLQPVPDLSDANMDAHIYAGSMVPAP